MVAGDLVNTASRIQSAASRARSSSARRRSRATEQAIVYEERRRARAEGQGGAGRALAGAAGGLGRGGHAEVGGPGGAVRRPRARAEADQGPLPRLRGRAAGAPRLGDRDRRDRQVAAGLGVLQVLRRDRRHRSSGTAAAASPTAKASTYWALADMVRMRCRIAEDEAAGLGARRSCTATLDEHLLDPEERAFVEPRLAHLLGLEEAAAGDRQDLFAAWRLFFERLADANPTVLAFEDMHWADTSLLDFIEYLLEWSRDYPLFVITLARPELHERRPSWGAGQRNFTSLYLEPLSEEAMEELLDGLVPGPAGAAARADPRAGRGRAAVRGRDGADAARPRAARPGRPGLPADRRDRDARGAGDAARADRRPPGRRLAPRSGGCCRTARCSARPSRARASPRSPASLPRSWSRCSRRSCARRCSASSRTRARPSAASTASCRTSFATSPTRRSPSGSARRGTWPPPSTSQRAFAGRGRDRRGARVPLPRRRRGRARGRGRRGRSGRRRGEMLARAGERAGSLGAPDEAQRYFEQAAALTRGARRPRRELLEQAGRLGWRRRTGPPRRGSGSSERSRCYEERREARARPPGSTPRSPTSTSTRGSCDAGGRPARAGARRARAGPRRAPTWPRRSPSSAASASSPATATTAREPLERALSLAERLHLPEALRRGAHQQGRPAAPAGSGRRRRGSCSRGAARTSARRAACTRARSGPRTTSAPCSRAPTATPRCSSP